MHRLMFARFQTLGSALPTRLSTSSRKWMGDVAPLAKYISEGPPVSVCGISTATKPVSSDRRGEARRIFVDHAFYKSKSVLRISPGKPDFKILESGDVVLERAGCLFMELAPAIAPRQYDWNRKQIFALSVGELGTLVGLSPSKGCEFFHDPNMSTSDAGKVRKTLKVEPKSDMTGYFFTLNVVNALENVNERLSVLVLKSEFAVMKSTFNYVMPYLMGWHAFFNPAQLDKVNLFGGQNSQAHKIEGNPDLEWEK